MTSFTADLKAGSHDPTFAVSCSPLSNAGIFSLSVELALPSQAAKEIDAAIANNRRLLLALICG